MVTGRVRAEELLLLHRNARGTLIAAWTVSVLLLGVFWIQEPALANWPWDMLLVWEAVLVMLTALALLLTTRVGLSKQLEGEARWLARATIAVYTAYGLTWGSVSWLIPSDAQPIHFLLIVVFSTGLLSASQLILTPVWQAFAGFALTILIPLAVRLLTLPQSFMMVVGGVCCLGLVTRIGQTLKASATFRELIELRFANVELIEGLRHQFDRADRERLAAEDANLAKTRFLAAASHDLRQPMQAQTMFLEALCQTDLDQHQRELLDNARASCMASGEMLNTLLDFSRIDAGVIQPQMQVFEVQTILHKVEVELASLADAKGLVFRVHDTSARVRSDPALVEMVVRNLVGNAIRYTPSGGVLIGCRSRQDAWVIEVWDTGIGIAPEHRADVYREFYQLGNPERDRRKGLGLGLSIAAGLAQRLGHSLDFRSTPGRGTVFRLTLPKTHDPLELSLRPERPQLQFAGLRILVIDDDQAVRTAITEVLCAWGCLAEAVGTLDEVAGQFGNAAPDLIVCDFRLSGRWQGPAVIAALRERFQRQIPAMLLTGDTASEHLRTVKDSGIPTLHKPASPQDLRRMMAQLLAAD